MRRFELTSPAFEGSVIYSFDDATDRLVSVDMSSVPFSEEMWKCIWSNLPATSKALGKVTGRTGVITELVEAITFDMFWKRYDDKARSSKLKTQRAWDKMPERERVKAYNYVPKYFQSIPPGVCKKYATTYLSDQLWNN